VLVRQLEEFEASLQTIPWFQRIGEALDATVSRLKLWDDWPGPEDESVECLCSWQQDFHDAIVGQVHDAPNSLEAIFLRVRDRVIELSKNSVPYDASEDAWHAPTSAVWMAGWTAGLVALCLATGRVIPPILEAQWRWYKVGRWPGALAAEPRSRDISNCQDLQVL